MSAFGKVGQRYPLRVQAIRDSQTGATAQRFIHHQPSQEQIFYYCSPAMTVDGRYIPCWSNVSGAWQIHAIDRQDEVSIQLSAMDTWPGSINHFPSDAPCLSLEYNRVYYHDGRRILWADIPGGQGGWLYERPDGFHLSAMSARGRYLAFSVKQDMPQGRVPDQRTIATYPQLHYRPLSLILAFDIETGNGEYCWGDHSFFEHVEMCPFDDDSIMFVDQSWTRRQQEAHIVRRSFCEDKRPLSLLACGFENYRGRTLDYIGHGFFTQDGYAAAQYVEYGNVDERNNFTDTTMFNLVIRPDGYGKRKAKFPGSGKPVHVHCQKAEGLWVGDAWTKPDGQVDMGWLCLMRNHFKTQEMSIAPLFQTSHGWHRPFHPHPWISPAEDQVVTAYNTGRDKNDNHMALVDIPANLRNLGKGA